MRIIRPRIAKPRAEEKASSSRKNARFDTRTTNNRCSPCPEHETVNRSSDSRKGGKPATRDLPARRRVSNYPIRQARCLRCSSGQHGRTTIRLSREGIAVTKYATAAYDCANTLRTAEDGQSFKRGLPARRPRCCKRGRLRNCVELFCIRRQSTGGEKTVGSLRNGLTFPLRPVP